MSQTGSVPAIADPTTLPSAPTAKATGIATTPTSTETTAFAAMTRCRCGTRVNEVSPLRWLHSLVTERMAMIGQDDRHRDADGRAEGAVADLGVGGEDDDGRSSPARR